MTAGKKNYNLRKSKRLSQKGLTEMVNVSRYVIWELGETSLNSHQLKPLSKVLYLDELLNDNGGACK